tara:strand:+ start:479 stop:961 length:483 start_codon:yes stop_codon:yes gene_type:complete
MEILALVAHNTQLQEQVEALQAQLAALQPKAKPIKTPCPHVTSKGQPCKKYCAPGLSTCKVHGKPRKEKPPPKEKPKKVHCTGVNMRGNPCKRKVLPDCTYCERHDPSLPPKVPTKKVKKKVVPCGLCETHGDVFDPGVTEAKWVDEATFHSRTMVAISA